MESPVCELYVQLLLYMHPTGLYVKERALPTTRAQTIADFSADLIARLHPRTKKVQNNKRHKKKTHQSPHSAKTIPLLSPRYSQSVIAQDSYKSLKRPAATTTHSHPPLNIQPPRRIFNPWAV